jgi:hypothetical protein
MGKKTSIRCVLSPDTPTTNLHCIIKWETRLGRQMMIFRRIHHVPVLARNEHLSDVALDCGDTVRVDPPLNFSLNPLPTLAKEVLLIEGK